MVDNCYGEFVETIEPTDVGADLIVGSLIKNPGGGLAPIGGYIAGKKEYRQCSYRLTSPGLGKEVGATLGVNQSFYQGIFPCTNSYGSGSERCDFAANVYERLGFAVVRTVRRAATISFRQSPSSTGKSNCFCKGIRQQRRSTAMWILNPGRCRDMTAM